VPDLTPLESRFQLQGKVAAVIGGAGFLCSTAARALADSGVHVTVIDAAPAPRENAADLPYLQCDVTSKEQLTACRDEIVRRHGRLDILLNGAGTNAPTPFFDITKEEIDRILAVNVSALVYACQVFGRTMVDRGAGSIINFASASSGPPLSKAFIYSVAKAGVVSLTQNLAREWATAGVRVNALRPGFFPTEWSMQHFIDADRKAKILGHTPMGRFGVPEELVGAILWLSSDAARFVTGSIVAVDGGFTCMTI
jgi:NAD(P)-dependent dehydrogenase (short-subunit alcohol dehydrogenase family)